MKSLQQGMLPKMLMLVSCYMLMANLKSCCSRSLCSCVQMSALLPLSSRRDVFELSTSQMNENTTNTVVLFNWYVLFMNK